MKGVIWIFLAVTAFGSTVGAQDTFPNATAIAALNDLLGSNLRVLDFYESLKSLYLSGGYAASGPFNGPIISTKNISQVIWDQMRRVVNQTRQEIKNGDFSLMRIDAQIKLYDTQNREEWLSKLAIEIAKHSEYPKNLAFAIRDLGKFLVDSGLSRTDYGSEANLQSKISTWLTEQSLSFEDTLTPLLTRIHIAIGPDSFGSLADVLEVLPYQVRGMWDQDSDALSYYTENIADQITYRETGMTLSQAFRNAFLNVTLMKETNETNFLYLMSKYDIEKMNSVQVLKAESGQITVRTTARQGTNYARLSNSRSKMGKVILDEKLDTEKMMNFLVQSAKYLEDTPSIESLENIRMAMIAGARLIYNLGSIDSALNLSSLVPAARNSDKDIRWSRRVDGALEVIKYLNRSVDERVGGQILLRAFLNEPNIRDEGLFLNSKNSNVRDMVEMFKKMKDVDQKVLGEVATTIQSWTQEKLREELNGILDSNRLIKVQNTFGGSSVQDVAEAGKVQDFLESLYDATVVMKKLKAFCNYFKIISSKVTNYSAFIQSFIDFIPLSRDGTWQDVWNALYSLSTTVFSTSNNFEPVLAPLIYVTQSATNMSLINLREVFLSLQQLSFGTQDVVETKVEFVKEFYGSLKMEEVTGILKGFDVDAKDIANKVDASMYVDDFLDVLESSGSQGNFFKLFTFHGIYTTKIDDPNESIELMNKMITYLHIELAKPDKSPVVRKSFVKPAETGSSVDVVGKNSDVASNGSTGSSDSE